MNLGEQVREVGGGRNGNKNPKGPLMRRADPPSMDAGQPSGQAKAPRDDRAVLLRLLDQIADECMTDEPDIVWIGTRARMAVVRMTGADEKGGAPA